MEPTPPSLPPSSFSLPVSLTTDRKTPLGDHRQEQYQAEIEALLDRDGEEHTKLKIKLETDIQARGPSRRRAIASCPRTLPRSRRRVCNGDKRGRPPGRAPKRPARRSPVPAPRSATSPCLGTPRDITPGPRMPPRRARISLRDLALCGAISAAEVFRGPPWTADSGADPLRVPRAPPSAQGRAVVICSWGDQ